MTPLVKEGEKVKKDEALVAVPDDDAGSSVPKPVPLSEALRRFDRVLERAVGSEHLRPADKAFVQRYLEALRRGIGK